LVKAGRAPYSTTAKPKQATRKLPAGEKTLPAAPLSVGAWAAAKLATEADELTAAVEGEESVLVAETSVKVRVAEEGLLPDVVATVLLEIPVLD
jgi:hypothetical protein